MEISEFNNARTFSSAIFNRNLSLSLPAHLDLSEVGRLVVWCPEYESSFGRVDLEAARNGEEATERPKRLTEVGPLIQGEHGVQGRVYIQDEETLIIRDFNFDGRVRFLSTENLKNNLFLNLWRAGSGDFVRFYYFLQFASRTFKISIHA